MRVSNKMIVNLVLKFENMIMIQINRIDLLQIIKINIKKINIKINLHFIIVMININIKIHNKIKNKNNCNFIDKRMLREFQSKV